MSRVMKDSGVEWIGKIPCEWSVCRIKNLARHSDSLFSDGDWIESPVIVDEGVRYLTTGNVGSGVFREQGASFISEETFKNLSCLAVYPDDLIMSRLNEPIGRSCIVPNTYPKYVVAVDVVVLRPDKQYSRMYIMYCTNTQGYNDEAWLVARGTTMQRISRSILGTLTIPMPLFDEQENIVKYLDSKCATIDRLISLQEEMIAELQAYKQSVITEAVTKGLDPNVPMKDRGVEGIGNLPVHWMVCKHKLIISSINSGVSVNAASNPATDTEIGVLKTSCVYGDVFKPEENKQVNEDEINLVACPVVQNTLIVSRMNTPDLVGSCGYVDNDYINLYLPDRLWKVSYVTNINVKYIWYYLTNRYTKSVLASIATGSSNSMKNIAQNQFEDLTILLPDYAEQCSIAAYLDDKIGKISKMIYIKQSKVDTLKEYKKSLIYECVTGKREIV